MDRSGIETLSVDHGSFPLDEEAAFSALTVLMQHLLRRGRAGTASPDAQRWLTVEEGARYAGVCDDTLRLWIAKGHLRAGRCGKVMRVRTSDIDEMLLSGRVDDGGERRQENAEEDETPVIVTDGAEAAAAAIVASVRGRRKRHG